MGTPSVFLRKALKWIEIFYYSIIIPSMLENVNWSAAFAILIVVRQTVFLENIGKHWLRSMENVK